MINVQRNKIEIPLVEQYYPTAYLYLGVGHLFDGLDHILFIFGLLFCISGLVNIIKTITAFTIAHSITLGLSVFNIISLPQATVEALIALTIVYLALEISKSNLKNRIQFAKKLIVKNDFIKIRFYEEKISSNRTIDLINYLKKDKKYELYFIMGADNLINFHKWHKWKSIVKKCNLLVFDRQGYKAKSLKSVTYNGVNKKRLSFIKFKKVNISSSQLRKV